MKFAAFLLTAILFVGCHHSENQVKEAPKTEDEVIYRDYDNVPPTEKPEGEWKEEYRDVDETIQE